MNTRILTGITTSGTPHLGNYIGAIQPAINNSIQSGFDSFFFLADYHALIKCIDHPSRIFNSSLEIAATWLAAGLDTSRSIFYRQSDVPEILELSWILTCVTSKGMMDRAHAYKSLVYKNTMRGLSPDHGISMGLFSYPILMAADILLFNANIVPVGQDQTQHVEMARDIAQRFNYLYKSNFFILPKMILSNNSKVLPGLDGRKMSKSYNNYIPLFSGNSKELYSSIRKIVTDSRKPGEPKDFENSLIYLLYRAFATESESIIFREKLINGISWGQAKEILYKCLENKLLPMRKHYAELIKNPSNIEAVLKEGASKARKLATPFMKELRQIIGLKRLNTYS